MFIIGELINGMYKEIGRAIKEKDKPAIQKCAIEQIKCGADALDVNCGPASRDPVSDIRWLVEVIQEVTGNQMRDILEVIHEFKIISDPSPKTIVGLSNVSQGTCVRSLINRTFLTMAIAYGLDAAILDPKDSDLMDAAITAELILNKQIYCDSYLDAYRKR